MPLSIRNPRTVALARDVAALKGKGITETIHEALAREMDLAGAKAHADRGVEMRLARLRAIQSRVAAWPRTGLKADKEFFDSLYDE